jgi:SNF2 family DNA or RNA helicase
MEVENKWYLIHDKLTILDKPIVQDNKFDHSYSNKNTIKFGINEIIIMDMIATTKAEQDNREKAFKIYEEHKIMPSIKKLDKIYNIMIYKQNKNIFTLVSIDHIQLKNIIEKQQDIPDIEFLKAVCRNHLLYNKANIYGSIFNTEKMLDKNNTDDLVKTIINKVGDIVDPMISAPDFMSDKIKLYKYQKQTIKWMIDREKHASINYNVEEEVPIGEVCYNALSHKFTKNDKNKIKFYGGILIDEVGLGKTIQNITASLLNSCTKTKYIFQESNKLHSKATLILCPSQLCGQWKREIETKINKKLKIVTLLTKVHFDKYTYKDILDADFVIVSYSFLDNRVFLDQWTINLSKPKSYYRSEDFNHKYVKKIIELMCDNLVNNEDVLEATNPFLFLINFHRIVVDEIHEVFTLMKYLYIKNILPLFTADNRWGLTGTPFDKNNVCLMNYIDYVTNYEFDIDNKMLVSNTVKNYLINNMFRRNTKKSVTTEYELLPIKESVVWLKFTHTERMMYNAYLANPNNSKESVFLRKLCCHPKLADEIKDLLSNCNTLEDVEKKMVGHYRSLMDESYNKLMYIKFRVKITERRMKLFMVLRQAKLLKKIGYDPILDKSTTNFELDEEDKIFIDKYGWNPIPSLETKREDKKDKKKNDEDDLLDMDDINDDLLLLDLDRKEDDDEDSNKKKITITNDNQDSIIKIIGKSWDIKSVKTYQNLGELLNNYNSQKQLQVKDYEGKKTTFDFYNNVIERIKNKYKKSEEKGEDEEQEEDEEDENKCGICFGEIPDDDIGVTKCGHVYCFQCIKTITEKQNKCPYCNKPLKNGELFAISYEKKKNNSCNLDKQKLINEVGTKLSNMIFYLKQTSDHVIIFSQWDDLLRKVGEVLHEYGIKNIFCKGNVYQMDKAIRTFNGDDSFRVIMLSSESAASGTNLTKASKVILLDPICGSYEFRKNMEGQAIGRAHRMGQTKQVEVVRFIIKDTIEEEIYNVNKKEDSKHNTSKIVFESNDEDITLSSDKMDELNESKMQSEKTKTKKTITVKKRTNNRLRKNIIDEDSDLSESD